MFSFQNIRRQHPCLVENADADVTQLDRLVVSSSRRAMWTGYKLEFHGTDTDTDTDTEIRDAPIV